MDIGFAGAGRMGTAMISRLLAAGHRVRFYDPDAAAGRELAAERVSDPVELGAGELSISVVTDGPALLDVVSRLGAPAGHLHVSMSTVAPATVREAALALPIVDAPVSGSVTLARSGELTAIVGASAEDYERARPVLEDLTRAQLLVGGVGAGSALKLAVNAVVASTNQAIGEALRLAEGFGLARGTAYDVLLASVISSPYVHYKRRAFMDPGGPVEGSIGMLRKDAELALASAADAGIELPGLALAAETLRLAAEHGFADRDVAAVMEWAAR